VVRRVIDPWSDFLAARLRAMQWLRSEGKTNAQIAAQLSADEAQITRIFKATNGRPDSEA
jgi:hypothetical protein